MHLSVRRDLPDPRSIVKPIPLPYPSHKGVKIQARTLEVYNAYLPQRDEVRHTNYSRRQDQINNKGFQTPKNVPYRIVGTPLYLEQADIILNGLGQLQQSIKDTMKNVETPITKPIELLENTKPIQGFSFRSLKESKRLINLQNEVKKNDDILKRVRLGQSLFQLLRVDEEKKKIEKESKREHANSQMRIRPMIDSDDDIDTELSEDENVFNELTRNLNPELNRLMTAEEKAEELKTDRKLQINDDKDTLISFSSTVKSANRPQTHPVKFKYKNIENFIRPLSVQESTITSSTGGSTMRRPKTTVTKQIKEKSKPYAPIYSSLLSMDDISDSDRNSITRQLCVLLWILESMSTEAPNYIGPLRTCFLINDLGGERVSEKSLNKTKEKEVQWNNFRKVHVEKKKKTEEHRNLFAKSVNKHIIAKRVMKPKASIVSIDMSNDDENESTTKEHRRVLETPDESYNDEESMVKMNQPKKTNEQSTLSLDNTLTESNQETALNHHQNFQCNAQDTNRESITISNFDFFLPNQTGINNTNYSITAAAKANDANTKRKYLRSGRQKSTLVDKKNQKQKKTNEFNLTEHELELLKIGDEIEMERIFNRGANKMERKNSVSLKAMTGPIHAVWSQKVIDYQKSLPSVKKKQNLEDIRNQFENVIDEKTIDVHKKLEQLFKKRIQNCMVKYQSMNLNERGLHKMLNAMKNNLIAYQRFEDSKNAAAQMVYYQWYLDLEILVDHYYSRNDCVLGKLLDKLAFHGKLNTRKKNEALFFRVIETLKIWELLSPDVMSAIEFCRDRILEIGEDDFEDWFRAKTQKYPELFVARRKNSEDKIHNNIINKTETS